MLAGALDRSRPVPCSHRHNLETLATKPLYTRVTPAVLHGYVESCWYDVADALHLRSGPWVARLQVVPVPSLDAAGHTVVRCDVSLLSGVGEFHDLPAAVTRTSLARLAAAGSVAGWLWCSDDQPGPKGSRFVDCRSPHRAQVTPTWGYIPAVGGRYPARAVRTRGQLICRRRVARLPHAEQLSSFGWWWSRQIWLEEGRPPTVAGVCWFFRRDRKLLPAVR